MVPDGVVPAPLKRFLIGIGVRAGEARTDTARVVTTTCRAVQWAGLARARETAAQLDALGLHLPELLGGAGEATAPCVACGSEARRLFCVRPGTPEGKKIVGTANARVGEAANRRVGRKQGRQTLAAVKEMHAMNGVLVCIACAAPRMAEVRALAARAPARTAAKDQLEAAQHEADAAQAARSARALERTAGKRVAEMEKPPKIDAATNANALWQTRCALAKRRRRTRPPRFRACGATQRRRQRQRGDRRSDRARAATCLAACLSTTGSIGASRSWAWRTRTAAWGSTRTTPNVGQVRRSSSTSAASFSVRRRCGWWSRP